MNRRSIGVCVVGNFDEEVFSPAGTTFLARFLLATLGNHGIPPANVIGHRDAGLMAGYDWRKIGPTGIRQFKTCPGILFPMDRVKQLISGKAPA